MAECLFTVTPEQIQDILGHVTEGVCRPFKVHVNNLVYFTIIIIILTLIPSSSQYIDCLISICIVITLVLKTYTY